MTKIFHFTLGTFKCMVINDGDIDTLTPRKVFGGAPEETLQREIDPYGLTIDGLLLIPVNVMYVDTGAHRVLIDNGGGPHQPDLPSGQLFAALDAEGIGVDQIDTMILSHGHWDHVGGNTNADGTLAFPQARYVMVRGEYEYWMGQSRSDENWITYDNLKAIENIVDLIGPEDEIVPGIQALPARGHTLDHSAYRISSAGETLYCFIDLIDHPIHFKHIDWPATWDLDPAQTIQSRRELFARAAREKALVHGAHLAFPGLGHVVTEDDHWCYQPLGKQ